MREKYIDERVGVFFTFGVRPNGNVDISNGENDSLFENLPKDIAEKVCDAQDVFRDTLYKLLEDV